MKPIWMGYSLLSSFILFFLVASMAACQGMTNAPEVATSIHTATIMATSTLDFDGTRSAQTTQTASAFTLTPTLTKTPTPTPTINTTALNFGEPILKVIEVKKPIFEDDFSKDKRWYGTTGGGSSRALPLSLVGGFLQTLNDGMRGYTHIMNPKVEWLSNFAVTVDAAFIEETRVRDRAIGLCWWPGDDDGERFLLYETGFFEGATCRPEGPCPVFSSGRIGQIPVEKIVSLTIIHRKGESAVYADGVALIYHKLSINNIQSGFSLCPHTFDNLQSNIKYDNVKVWNLDLFRIPKPTTP